MVTFGDQVACLVLELVKGLAADLGKATDSEDSKMIRNNTYVDDGAWGGNKEHVERVRETWVDGKFYRNNCSDSKVGEA